MVGEAGRRSRQRGQDGRGWVSPSRVDMFGKCQSGWKKGGEGCQVRPEPDLEGALEGLGLVAPETTWLSVGGQK